MPRQPRIEYPGAIYHVMNRGDRSEDIIHDEGDNRRFVETLEEACAKTGWQVHAWCLMRNHFHLVIETPRANLAAGMRWFLGTYTARFNRRHKLFGHLFSGRYKSLIVDGSGTGYLKTVCDYVHLNPVRAGILKSTQPLESYPWSSYPQYLTRPSQRRPSLRVDRLLGEWRIEQDDSKGRREFGRLMTQRRFADDDTPKELRRAWCWGGDKFREKLLSLLADEVGEHHYGQETHEAEAVRAERLIAEGLRDAGWGKGELALRPKGDHLKVRLARRIREQTTMDWRWIAQRLQMGHWRSAANAVRLKRK